MSSHFVEALADLAAEAESDEQLVLLRAQAMSKISEGGGEVTFLTQASQNGKNAQQECRMDAAELLGAVNQALRIYRGSTPTVTYPDFSCLR